MDRENEASAEQIGMRIKRRREEIGLRQKDVADRLVVAEGTISRYESGIIAISVPDLIRIAKILYVDLNYLLFDLTSAEREQMDPAKEIVYEPIYEEMRAASQNGQPFTPEEVAEIAAIMKYKRDAKKNRQGR